MINLPKGYLSESDYSTLRDYFEALEMLDDFTSSIGSTVTYNGTTYYAYNPSDEDFVELFNSFVDSDIHIHGFEILKSTETVIIL